MAGFCFVGTGENKLHLNHTAAVSVSVLLIWKRDPKHKRLKERFVIRQNRTKCANFQRSPFFFFFFKSFFRTLAVNSVSDCFLFFCLKEDLNGFIAMSNSVM